MQSTFVAYNKRITLSEVFFLSFIPSEIYFHSFPQRFVFIHSSLWVSENTIDLTVRLLLLHSRGSHPLTVFLINWAHLQRIASFSISTSHSLCTHFLTGNKSRMAGCSASFPHHKGLLNAITSRGVVVNQ